MTQPSPSYSGRRLDSWKEIAAFFGRDERTVRRWEKESGLPVRRVPGGAKGRVFAYESELREWLGKPQAVNSENVADGPKLAGTDSARKHFSLRTAGKWTAAVAACAALAAGILAYRKNHGFAVHASETRASRADARPVRKPATPETEDFYLKGRYYWNKRTPEDLNKAVDFFTQAIVQDPGYAPAYVGLADCYNLLREYSVMPPSEAYPRALAAAREAVKLDDTSAEAHNSLAFVTFYWDWDAATAEREFKRAIALNPYYVEAHHWYATFLLVNRRYPEAIAEIERARELEPSSTSIMADKGFILYWAGQREQGLALLKQIETTEPAFLSPHLYFAEVDLKEKDYPDYLSESMKVAMLRHDQGALAVVKAAEKGFAAGGAHGMWESMLPIQRNFYRQGVLAPYPLAQTYSELGEKQEALRYLREAYEKRNAEMVALHTDSTFDGLRGDPSFDDLLARASQPRVD